MNLLYIKLLTVVAILGGLWFWHSHSVDTAVKNNTVAIQKLALEDRIRLEKQYREVESNLRKAKEQSDELSKKQIADLNVTVGDLYSSLHNFKSTINSTADRSAGIAEDATGETRIIYRETAEDLIAEARRADEVRINLLSCYRQYDSVKSQLDELRK